MINRRNVTLPKVLSKIFIFILLALPLITWGGYYEGPKVFVFTMLGVLLIVFWLLKIIVLKENISFTRADTLYLVWLFILTVASIAGIHSLESLMGGSYRHQGVIFFLTLWLIYKTAAVLKKEDRGFLNKGVAFIIVVEALIVLFQYSTGRMYFGKPLGTIGEANAVAGFLAIGSYFVFRSLDSIFFALPVISILIPQSRSGLIALLPNLIFLLRNLKSEFRRVLIFLLVAGGIGFVVVVSRAKTASLFEDRGAIMQLGIRESIKRPLLGYGAESGEVVYGRAFSADHFKLNGLIIDRSHNLLLDVFMWSGSAGLIVFVAFLVAFYKSLDNKFKKLAFMSFVIYSMFQPLGIVHWLLPFLL
jgi:hypothetical protein